MINLLTLAIITMIVMSAIAVFGLGLLKILPKHWLDWIRDLDK